MIFTQTSLQEAFIIEPELKEDERGYFFRTWCSREFEAHGLNNKIAQASGVYNKKRGTLRGMHWQAPPHEEAKLVRVVRGSVYDVIVDIRPSSSTYKQWFSIELTATSQRMLFVPGGFAHGYLTLEDDTELFYLISQFYQPESARGFRWNDAAFGIDWPAPVKVISERDRTYPDFAP